MYQVPGNYIKKVNVKEGSNELGKWEDLKEEYVLFPSSESKEDYIDDHEKVNKFGTGVGDYFPNYVGIIGEGLYVDDNLTDFKINILIEFYCNNEIIGFKQFIYVLYDITIL